MKRQQRVLGKVRKISNKADRTRRIEFVISDESRDRHGTVIPASAWDLKPYLKNPVVFYMHDGYGGEFTAPDPDTLIGRSVRVWVTGSELRAVIEFEPAEINPLSEKVFRKILFGSLKAVSAGFIETERGSYGTGDRAKYGPEGTYYFGKVELLEISVVNIASNKNALKKGAELAPCARSYVKKALDIKPSKIEILTLQEIEVLLQGKDLGLGYTDPREMRKEIWKHEKQQYFRYKEDIRKREAAEKQKEKAGWDAKRKSWRRSREDKTDFSVQEGQQSEITDPAGEDAGRYSGIGNIGYLYD